MLSKKQKKAINVSVVAKDKNVDVSSAIAGVVGAQAIAAIATADATDLATAEALANACKAKINELLAALKSS